VVFLTLFLGEYPEKYDPIIQDFPIEEELATNTGKS
jgi:hypothetical protein